MMQRIGFKLIGAENLVRCNRITRIQGSADTIRVYQMLAQDLLNVLQKKPFEPFRIHASDGTVYDVHHPELVMPGLSIAIVGIPADPSQPIFGRTEHLALNHIVRLEPLSKESASSGGQG